MKVWYFSSIFPQPYDVTRGIYCYNLCKALSIRHQVQVIAPQPWPEYLRHGSTATDRTGKQDTDWEGLPVFRPIYYYPPKVLHWAYDWFMWQSVRGTIRRLLMQSRPDCIISYWVHPDGAVAVKAGRLAGAPTAIQVGGSDVLLLPRQPSRRRCVQRALQAADFVFPVSEDLKNNILNLGVARSKVQVICQGVDGQLFHPGDQLQARLRLDLPAKVPMLLWVGRIAPVKGLPVLLRSCSLLKAWGQAFHLYLIGNGPSRDLLENEAKQLNLADVVTFLGDRRPVDLPDWYRAADLMVLSSLSEGIPNVLREAAACGLPFVASRVGGVPEIADENIDRLVPPGDPVALAQAIQQGLAERRVRPHCQSRFPTWEENAEQMVRLLRPDLADVCQPTGSSSASMTLATPVV